MREVAAAIVLSTLLSACLAGPGVQPDAGRADPPVDAAGLSGHSLRTPAIAFIVDNVSALSFRLWASGSFSLEECLTSMFSIWTWADAPEWITYRSSTICEDVVFIDTHGPAGGHRATAGLRAIYDLTRTGTTGTAELAFETLEPMPLDGPALILWQHPSMWNVTWMMNVTGGSQTAFLVLTDPEPDCSSVLTSRTGSGDGAFLLTIRAQRDREVEIDLDNRTILHIPLAGFGVREASLTLSDESVIDLSGGGASPVYGGWRPPWLVVEHPGPAKLEVAYDIGSQSTPVIAACNIPTIETLSERDV